MWTVLILSSGFNSSKYDNNKYDCQKHSEEKKQKYTHVFEDILMMHIMFVFIHVTVMFVSIHVTVQCVPCTIVQRSYYMHCQLGIQNASK